MRTSSLSYAAQVYAGFARHVNHVSNVSDFSNRIFEEHALSALLNGRFGISPKMAIRLSKAFGGSAESWLIQQAQYDLWQVTQIADEIKVKAFSS